MRVTDVTDSETMVLTLEDVHTYLSRFDTTVLPPQTQDAIAAFQQSYMPFSTEPASTAAGATTYATEVVETPDALPTPYDVLDQRDTARFTPDAATRASTSTLRASILQEQIRQMRTVTRDGPPTQQLTAIVRNHETQEGATFRDMWRQLDAAGTPPAVRDAILEFTFGHLGVSTMPYFVQEQALEQPTLVLPTVFPDHWPTWFSREHWYSLGVAGVGLLFVIAQVIIVLQQRTGPFGDEAIYIYSGIRALQGYGLSDNYLTWFAGSLLWPICAALAYRIGGLVGARLLAVACTSFAVIAVSRATRNLFGQAASFWATVAFVLSGPLIHLAHLAVYDQIALAGVATSFWAITKVKQHDERRWLVVAAFAFAIAVIAKYPMILCVIPLVLLVLALRQNRATADLFILLFLITAGLLIYVLPLRGQLVTFLIWREQNNPSFGETTAMVRFTLVYYGLPAWALAMFGAVFTRGRRRIALILLIGVAIWPLYHLLTDNAVGAEKHIVFGFLFGYPLAGLALAKLWEHRNQWVWLARPAVIAGLVALAVVGANQAKLLDASWPDTRPSAAFLAAHVQPDQIILASDGAPYQMALYAQGKISSPWNIYDESRVASHELQVSICQVSWFVDEQNSNGWPASVRQQMLACGTFVQVFTSTTMVTNVGRSLTFITYPVTITVWENVASQ